jgi:hypothetical protein
MGFVGNAVSSVLQPVGQLLGGVTGSVVQPLAAGMSTQSKYNAQMPNAQEQLNEQLAAIQNQHQLEQQQKSLGQMLMMQAAGQGPNPALEQFKMNANQANAQAAGLMASQKGINPGLAARLIASRQAQAGQDIAGQSAAIQAQQQLAAQQAAANQQAQMAQQNMGIQSLVNNASLGVQNTNAQTAMGNAQTQNQVMGGILGGVGSALSGGKAKGGKISYFGEHLKQGGKVKGSAKVSGDSEENDTVHAMLSPGEVVIPRTLVDNPEKAKKFIEHINKNKGDNLDDFKKALAKRKGK